MNRARKASALWKTTNLGKVSRRLKIKLPDRNDRAYLKHPREWLPIFHMVSKTRKVYLVKYSISAAVTPLCRFRMSL